MMTDYVELHCHSNFSLLDGASHPEDLVARARELEMPALAITDHDGLYGAVRFYKAARQAGIRPIIGAELTVDPGHHITLLPETTAAIQISAALLLEHSLTTAKESRLSMNLP